MSRFDESVCRNLELASHREWLETNGIGGFSSSTIIGLNTRRYHALLTAATRPPVGRLVLLSKLEETLIVDGRRTELSCNRYPGVVHPLGYQYLKEFRQDPFPTFVYEVDGIEIEKSIFMVQGENTTVIQYRASRPCMLELTPLLAFRDYHATTHENGALNPDFEHAPGMVTCRPYPGLPPLRLAYTAGEIRRAAFWYRNFEYDAERERGLDYREDLFNPLVLQLDMVGSDHAAVIASTEMHSAQEAGELRSAEIGRRAPAQVSDPFVRTLISAADQFIVQRGSGRTIIAGYHWFSDWGRDTMISLPGLTLATGRHEDARNILLAFAAVVDRGMLPNRFPDSGEAPSTTPSMRRCGSSKQCERSPSAPAIPNSSASTCTTFSADIVAWHERGTRYGIRLHADGLLGAGEPGTQLTWMDARVGGHAVTPRRGKPVEIQALWYNAVRIMEDFAQRFGDAAGRTHYHGLAERARAAFTDAFWNEAAGCLFDVVDGAERDGSIRPNQVFAVSLFHSMLLLDKAKFVMDTVERDLLTPYGLRTLSPSDPHYQGRFDGGPERRDSAYHQGTVWPWLMGPFLGAWLKVNGDTAGAREQAVRRLDELRHFASDEGLGQIPEVFDGDAPHRPGGCIAQAWSVAELLRVLDELGESARVLPQPRP